MWEDKKLLEGIPIQASILGYLAIGRIYVNNPILASFGVHGPRYPPPSLSTGDLVMYFPALEK